MNLKKVKDNGDKPLIHKVLKTVDSIIADATKEDTRAAKVDKYRKDMSLLVEDGLSTPQDIITTIEEVVEPEVKTKLMAELSEKMDWPESLDEHIWDYIQHTDGGNSSEALKVVVSSGSLSDEDRVIVVDEILGAYE